VTIEITEEERQMALLAFAHLARPGWDWALAQLALKMDNRVGEGEAARPEMFDQFKALAESAPPRRFLNALPRRKIPRRRDRHC